MKLNEPITEEWLKEVGFRWSQIERQPTKHWTLWLGGALYARGLPAFTGTEDLGIELSQDRPGAEQWFCWLRDDSAHRYHRFIHIRHLFVRGEVIQLVVALTGQSWFPVNHLNGEVMRPERADAVRKSRERLDQRLIAETRVWYPSEEDPSRGRPLREHLDIAIAGGKAK